MRKPTSYRLMIPSERWPSRSHRRKSRVIGVQDDGYSNRLSLQTSSNHTDELELAPGKVIRVMKRVALIRGPRTGIPIFVDAGNNTDIPMISKLYGAEA